MNVVGGWEVFQVGERQHESYGEVVCASGHWDEEVVRWRRSHARPLGVAPPRTHFRRDTHSLTRYDAAIRRDMHMTVPNQR